MSPSVLLSGGVFVVLVVLILPPSRGQGSECSCDVTNSRCDESGVCRCDPGWDGELCDRCVLMPGCVHGSCRQPWQCRCETGWAGRFCDRDLSVCSRRPCQNGATCVMEDGGEYACLCPHGFHGNNCQLKAGPCLQERSPCKNGGLCEDADGFAAALTCRCLAGFTGARCETDVDDCLMKPCANGATCLDAINRFLCVCPAGFTGRFCTVNVDDCASRPCLHAGRCLDRAGGFHCVCRPGYAGTTCEMPLRGWTPLGWDGGGGSQMTTSGKSQSSSGNNDGNSSSNGGNSSGKNSSGENSGRPSDRLLRVTVSERGAGSGGGLSRLQLTVLLVLAGVTLGVVALTAGVVLQRYCRDRCGHAPCCWTLTSSSSRWQRGEPECQISFLNVAEPEKKKLNTEVV